MAFGKKIDFLIITAFRVETEAVLQLLQDVKPVGPESVGTITREAGRGVYTVAVTEVGGSGSIKAQDATYHSLGRTAADYVILTGIAAGFAESGVSLGDVLIPRNVFNYEVGKVLESGYESRAFLETVSATLWRAATELACDAKSDWASKIAAKRPDNSDRPPMIHFGAGSVLGCGEKVVADVEYVGRELLLSKFERDAIGLEMESAGVIQACRGMDARFLVVKAVQDDATGAKDAAGAKDAWRAYAASAAAAFTIGLIRRYELGEETRVEHLRELRQLIRLNERASPQPVFQYTVRRAGTYDALRMQETFAYDPAVSTDPTTLVPHAGMPYVVLHGGGGAGKTTILNSLMPAILDLEQTPVLIDLKQYNRSRPAGGAAPADATEIVREVLANGSAPRRTDGELQRLAAEGTGLTLLIDGVNEVTAEVRTALVDYATDLARLGPCYVLATDRFGPNNTLPFFQHAAVDRLREQSVKELIDRRIGAGTHDALDPALRTIFERPFFLRLALDSGNAFSRARTWNDIFVEFFRERMRLQDEELERIANAPLGSIGANGLFDPSRLRAQAGDPIFFALAEARVLDESSGFDFEHDLWRDYLVSRSLAKNRTWTIGAFDAATGFASSLECLPLTIEQLESKQLKETFLKRVFDWHYPAAAECLREFHAGRPEAQQVSAEIRTAILAAIAERRFDRVYRTRVRADEVLGAHRYDLARPYRESATIGELRDHVRRLNFDEPWAGQWKALFVRSAGAVVTDDEVELIRSDDPLIGWAAANTLRRSQLSEQQQGRIRNMTTIADAEQDGTFRWRPIHVLGGHPNQANADVCLNALRNDPYHWARYGAARAAVEIAANADPELRRRVIEALSRFVGEGGGGVPATVRRQVFGEIIDVANIANPAEGWRGSILGLLRQIRDAEISEEHRRVFAEKVRTFDAAG